jgi:hypothetical protein
MSREMKLLNSRLPLANAYAIGEHRRSYYRENRQAIIKFGETYIRTTHDDGIIAMVSYAMVCFKSGPLSIRPLAALVQDDNDRASHLSRSAVNR